jgi:predicted DNA-binding protein (UPF0251 family)
MIPKLSYDEREAFALVRKTIKRKPEMAAELMRDMSREVAVSVLLQAKQELAHMLAISQAFSAAAGAIAKMDKPPEDPQ